MGLDLVHSMRAASREKEADDGYIVMLRLFRSLSLLEGNTDLYAVIPDLCAVDHEAARFVRWCRANAANQKLYHIAGKMHAESTRFVLGTSMPMTANALNTCANYVERIGDREYARVTDFSGEPPIVARADLNPVCGKCRTSGTPCVLTRE